MTASLSMDRYLADLKRIFAAAPSKHAGHVRARPLLEEISHDPRFLTEALRRYLEKPGSLATRNYPVVGIDIALNEYFGLVLNCWIPLPDGSTDMSTKAIHHHGNMLLSTTTLFGPGYEHWMFTKPVLVDAADSRFTMKLLERGLHPQYNVAFVPEDTPHVPMYPPSLTVTMALWTNKFPTTWRDRLKRLPFVVEHSETLRQVARQLGLTRALDLKVVEYFDYYPDERGFVGMKVRQEFERGSNEDHLYSLFHILQKTGNERLAPVIERRLTTLKLPGRTTIEKLLADLEEGRPIAGRLSPMHTGLPYANFTAAAIERALAACDADPPNRSAHRAAAQR